MKKQSDCDWLVKIVVIGDSGVGKTNFLLRFCDNSFESSHISTQGVELKIKTIDMEGKRIKMQIWDTSGSEIFKDITTNYYKGAIGFFLIYSVNDKDTFNNTKYWMNTIKQYASQNVCVMLIGNKSDESNRQVTIEEGEALAKQFEIPFFETSAKEGTEIVDAFNAALKQVKAHLEKEELAQTRQKEQEPEQNLQQQEGQVQQIEQKKQVYELIKGLIIGDAGVGKTQILLRFCEDRFSPQYISTNGMDFKIKTIEKEGNKIKMQIWDTSGQERFRKVIQSYYKGANAIILVYSVDSKESFINIKNQMNQIYQSVSEDVSAVLIGNKADTSKREVTVEEGQELAQELEIPFFETSAKEGTNIADAFFIMAKLKKKVNLQKEEITQIQQAQQVDEIPVSEKVQVQQRNQKDEVCERFKALIIGDAGVGKTNILLKFCEGSFQPQYIPTIGIDFKIKTIEDKGKKIKIQIWDTSGQEQFISITQSYYKGTMGIMLVYSVNDKNTFNNIKYWMNSIKQYGSENVPVMLIGNKIDQSNREVSQEEGEDLAKNFGIPFLETSAKEGTNVADVFFALVNLEKNKPQKEETTQITQKIEQKPEPKQQEEVYVKQIEQKKQVYELIKGLIVGDAGVGKTNILLRFCDDSYQPQYISTIGVDFKIKTMDEEGKKIKMQIWDTSGQERFKTITQSYYKGATAIMLVYSVTDKDSFNNINYWMNQIKQHASQNVCVILIGNKSDESNRQVTIEEGEALAKQLGIPFFETSAKMGNDIADAFNTITKSVIAQLDRTN